MGLADWLQGLEVETLDPVSGHEAADQAFDEMGIGEEELVATSWDPMGTAFRSWSLYRIAGRNPGFYIEGDVKTVGFLALWAKKLREFSGSDLMTPVSQGGSDGSQDR